MRRKATSMGQPHKAFALRAIAGQAPRRPGFTLIEIVVAVGAVALVAVGLASIFDTVGKTVTGGRRVSVLNTYAGLLERQMRADFDAMSRDGFLVIRQQWVDVDADGKYTPGTDRVPVSADDVAPRGRRVDEIVFFANGHFASGHQPTWPGVQATSGTAMVYYGHGQTTRPTPNPPGDPTHQVYRNPFPKVSDRNNDPTLMLGMAPAPGQPADDNPNYYAGNWTLLRRLTLLSKPGTADASSTTDRPFNLNPSLARDHAVLKDQITQVGLQPATSSIFRSIASVYPNSPPATSPTLRMRSDGGFNRPFPASGIVDIATTDLNEIRMTVTSGGVVGPALVYPDGITNANQLPLLSIRGIQPTWETANDAYRGGRPAAYNELDRMQAWMSDAFPTDSRNSKAPTTFNDFVPDAADTGALGTRMRYEPQSTDLLAAMSFLPDGTPIPTTPTTNQKIQIAEARGDQLLLGSGNLVPHCSEFIVEWSFGEMEKAGDPLHPPEVVWHGPQRQVGAGTVRPYPWDSQNFERAKQVPVAGVITNTATGVSTGLPNQLITDRLIYGYSPVHDGTPGEACLTSYFGWTDPTYAPAIPANSVMVGGNATWPWPRMIRVTITLSDPLEPNIESTFQYVFTTPADPK